MTKLFSIFKETPVRLKERKKKQNKTKRKDEKTRQNQKERKKIQKKKQTEMKETRGAIVFLIRVTPFSLKKKLKV